MRALAGRAANSSSAPPIPPVAFNFVGPSFVYDPDRPDVWTWLQAWYASQCDGDWEHGYGISISTLDNPGWRVKINLPDRSRAAAGYERRETHRSEDDWCVTWTEEDTFHAACGPTNLAEALHDFRVWVTTRIRQKGGGS